MNTMLAGSPMAYARSSGRNSMVHIDGVTIALVLAISLLGLVMVTSASVSIASKESGQAFYYLERQLLLMLMGGASAALIFCIPTQALERLSLPLLITALLLLFLVLIVVIQGRVVRAEQVSVNLLERLGDHRGLGVLHLEGLHAADGVRVRRDRLVIDLDQLFNDPQLLRGRSLHQDRARIGIGDDLQRLAGGHG